MNAYVTPNYNIYFDLIKIHFKAAINKKKILAALAIKTHDETTQCKLVAGAKPPRLDQYIHAHHVLVQNAQSFFNLSNHKKSNKLCCFEFSVNNQKNLSSFA